MLATVYALAAAKEAANAPHAMRMLERARSADYFEKRAIVDRLKQDRDFTALRGRDDFKKLIAELDQAPPMQ
jgi:hypothetical protein